MNVVQLWRIYRWWKKKGEPMLGGYKTYLCAFGIGVAATAHALGFIDDATYQTVLGVLGAGGLAALRAGVAKQ